jgi:hypothetical protein
VLKSAATKEGVAEAATVVGTVCVADIELGATSCCSAAAAFGTKTSVTFWALSRELRMVPEASALGPSASGFAASSSLTLAASSVFPSSSPLYHIG